MKPLSGVKVLDFTRQMAGPMAAQFLSDYGADVVKFEATPTGDPARRTGTDFVGDESTLFPRSPRFQPEEIATFA